MRVTLLMTGIALGGAEVQGVWLARELKREGMDVDIITMLDPVAFVDDLHAADIPVTSLGMQRGKATIGAYARCLSCLRSSRPDVVISLTYPANMLGRLSVGARHKCRLITSVRTMNFGGREQEIAFRCTNFLSDCVVMNSRRVADSLVARRILNARDVRIVPNALRPAFEEDLSGRREELRRQYGFRDGEFVWVMVARFWPDKDQIGVVRAFASIDVRPHRLLFIGEGVLESTVREEVARCGVEDIVEFVGATLNVRDRLWASDGFVLSTAREGLPNAIMEAMACGLPVVASDVGGVSELVEDGKTGRLTNYADSDTLRDAMIFCEGLPAKEWTSIGTYARKQILVNHSADRIRGIWIDLLRSFD